MTREEAIVYFESLLKRFEEMHETETSYWGKVHTETTIEAIRTALTALQPVSREQVEKVWRGEWKIITTHNGCTPDQDCVCSMCGASGIPDKAFCDSCGAPMTDEAVEMVMERLEALHNA